MKEFEVLVEAGSHGQAFEVSITVNADDADDARGVAESMIRDNMYIVAGEPEEVEDE